MSSNPKVCANDVHSILHRLRGTAMPFDYYYYFLYFYIIFSRAL